MNKFIKPALTIGAGIASALAPMVAMAQTFPELQPAGSVDIKTVLGTIVNYVLGLAGAIAVIYLIWAGIQYITGGAKGAEAAKASIVNAIIGVVVILLSYVIVQAVITAVGG
jgi:type IV secretory pathway VirB2 component (pilin)